MCGDSKNMVRLRREYNPAVRKILWCSNAAFFALRSANPFGLSFWTKNDIRKCLNFSLMLKVKRAIRPERSEMERGRTSPKQLAGSV